MQNTSIEAMYGIKAHLFSALSTEGDAERQCQWLQVVGCWQEAELARRGGRTRHAQRVRVANATWRQHIRSAPCMQIAGSPWLS